MAANTTAKLSQAEVRELRDAFARIDANGDGRLSASELRDALASVPQSSSQQPAKSEADFQAMIAEYDTDGDGCLDFSEFLILVQGMREAEAKKGAGNAGLASVVSGLLDEWNVDVPDPETKRVLLPFGMQRLTSEELSRSFQ